MRGWTLGLLMAAVAVAGCLDDPGPSDDQALSDLDPCADPVAWTLFLGPGWTLGPELPPSGASPGNGFDEAFLTNDLDEWRSAASTTEWVIEGDLVLDLWTQGNSMPAPIVLGGDPGEGYHFFNQFGTEHGFVPSYAVEYANALGDAEVRHFTETFAMPEGGLVWEVDTQLRLLLTNLVLDDPQDGRGPVILWGGDTPSAITFTATCRDPTGYLAGATEQTAVSIPFNRGLLTGAVPAEEGLNQQSVPFTLHNGTDRLVVRLIGGGTLPVKSDVDMVVLDASGTEVWNIGSPYTDEIGTLYRANLDAFMPPGDYIVRVDSYSGISYGGTLSITQQVAA